MTDVHSKEAQRQAIFLLWKTSAKAKDIHKNLRKTHGEKTVGLATVCRWLEEFKRGGNDVADLPRRGRPNTSQSLSRRIQDFLDEDARVSVRMISDRLHAPRSSVMTACVIWVS